MIASLLNALKLRSKTVNFNALVGAIIVICNQFDLPISEEIINAVLIIGNVLLRFLTDQSLSDK